MWSGLLEPERQRYLLCLLLRRTGIRRLCVSPVWCFFWNNMINQPQLCEFYFVGQVCDTCPLHITFSKVWFCLRKPSLSSVPWPKLHIWSSRFCLAHEPPEFMSIQHRIIQISFRDPMWFFWWQSCTALPPPRYLPIWLGQISFSTVLGYQFQWFCVGYFSGLEKPSTYFLGFLFHHTLNSVMN